MWLKIFAEFLAIAGMICVSYSAFIVSYALGFFVAGAWLLFSSLSLLRGIKS